MADDDRGREQPQRVRGADRAGPPAQSERTANAGPIAEDDITEWLGAAKLRSAAEPSPAVKPSPAEKPGARLAVQVVIVVLVIGTLAVAAVRHFARTPGSGPASSTGARQEAVARNEAAAWVARQVSRDHVVSCDQVMCAALTAHGFPRRDLLVLGPTSPSYPVSSAVVVETAAVRDMFGSSLATAWAPAVLASFGSGPAAITVRVIAPHGAAAYQTLLGTDLADRKNAGAALLHDPAITVSATAGWQLTAGQVDSRLLLALAALARHAVREHRPPRERRRSAPIRRPDRERAGGPPGPRRVRQVRPCLPEHGEYQVPPGRDDGRGAGERPGRAAGRGHRAEPARGVGSPLSRSSMTRAPNLVAATPSPV